MWIAFQFLLVYIGLKSSISGRQALIGKGIIVFLIILVILTWTGKFLIGPEFY
jgi:hypothetical protein